MEITWRVWRMIMSLLFAVVYLCLGGVLFWWIEGETFSTSPFNSAIEGKAWGTYLNAIYFCAITLTTIGYGDLVPTTTMARGVLFAYAAVGLGVMGFTMATVSDVAVNKTQHYLHVGSSYIYSEKKREQDLNKSKENLSLLRSFCLRITMLSSDTKKIIVGVSFFFFIMCSGSLVFMFIEDWPYIEALYFCFVTLTTIGYGDYTPQTTMGRAIVIPFAFLGLGITSFLLTRFAQLFVITAKDLTSKVNKTSGLLITFDFEETIEEEISEILKLLNTSIIPHIRTQADAEKLQASLHGVLHSIEMKKLELKKSKSNQAINVTSQSTPASPLL